MGLSEWTATSLIKSPYPVKHASPVRPTPPRVEILVEQISEKWQPADLRPLELSDGRAATGVEAEPPGRRAVAGDRPAVQAAASGARGPDGYMAAVVRQVVGADALTHGRS